MVNALSCCRLLSLVVVWYIFYAVGDIFCHVYYINVYFPIQHVIIFVFFVVCLDSQSAMNKSGPSL